MTILSVFSTVSYISVLTVQLAYLPELKTDEQQVQYITPCVNNQHPFLHPSSHLAHLCLSPYTPGARHCRQVQSLRAEWDFILVNIRSSDWSYRHHQSRQQQ